MSPASSHSVRRLHFCLREFYICDWNQIKVICISVDNVVSFAKSIDEKVVEIVGRSLIQDKTTSGANFNTLLAKMQVIQNSMQMQSTFTTRVHLMQKILIYRIKVSFEGDRYKNKLFFLIQWIVDMFSWTHHSIHSRLVFLKAKLIRRYNFKRLSKWELSIKYTSFGYLIRIGNTDVGP